MIWYILLHETLWTTGVSSALTWYNHHIFRGPTRCFCFANFQQLWTGNGGWKTATAWSFHGCTPENWRMTMEKSNTEWWCISYQKWWFSNVMLVFRGVYWRCICKIKCTNAFNIDFYIWEGFIREQNPSKHGLWIQDVQIWFDVWLLTKSKWKKLESLHCCWHPC